MGTSRQVLDSLLPPGPIWDIKKSGDFDNLLDGVAENSDDMETELAKLAYIRDPQRTPLLADLEREYGLISDISKPEAERRDTLAAAKFEVFGDGDLDSLQDALDRAGFDAYNVQVHHNDPAANPVLFLGGGFPMVAGGGNAIAGNQNAYARVPITNSDALLVNGDLITLTQIYSMGAGSQFAFAGNGNAISGFFQDFTQEFLLYKIPINPIWWPFIFFVGGDATRDGGTNELLTIAQAMVPEDRKQELKRIILKKKPLHSWAGLVITFT